MSARSGHPFRHAAGRGAGVRSDVGRLQGLDGVGAPVTAHRPGVRPDEGRPEFRLPLPLDDFTRPASAHPSAEAGKRPGVRQCRRHGPECWPAHTRTCHRLPIDHSRCMPRAQAMTSREFVRGMGAARASSRRTLSVPGENVASFTPEIARRRRSVSTRPSPPSTERRSGAEEHVDFPLLPLVPEKDPEPLALASRYRIRNSRLLSLGSRRTLANRFQGAAPRDQVVENSDSSLSKSLPR